MNNIFILLFLFFTATAVATTTCPVSRDHLLQCVKHFLDTNNNGVVSLVELTVFFETSSCLPEVIKNHMTPTIIMNECDHNQDGLLTTADWEHPSACIQKQNHQFYLCLICQQCGYTF
jgi:hypothetical protein